MRFLPRLCLFLALLWGGAAQADWTRVQGTSVQNTNTTVTTLAFAATVTSGDNVVGAVLLSTGFTLSSVTDDKSNSYTVFDSHDDGVLYTAAFRSNSFLTNGPKTLTITASASAGSFWVVQDEFSPPAGATSPSLDGSSTTFNSAGTSFTSFSTTLTDDLAYAASFSNGTSTTGSCCNAGTGSGTAVMSEWAIQATAATVTMNMATQTNHFWGPAFAINGGSAAAATCPMTRSLMGVGC